MHPRHWIHCAALNKKGVPCGNNGNCPKHKEANEQRRREDDEARMAKLREDNRQGELFPRLTRAQIAELLSRGYQEADRSLAPCGCQG